VEARLNATNQALQPSAGGIIEYWSDAIEGEIRDDQGISLHNPDTDVFMKYTPRRRLRLQHRLLLTVGDTRLDCYRHMAEVIRQTTHARQGPGDQPRIPLRPGELVHRPNINARPTTRFIVPYLTAVGELKREAGSIDLPHAWQQLCERELASLGGDDAQALAGTLQLKQSLLLRPVKSSSRSPHVLSGWLSVHRDCYRIDDGRVRWTCNPDGAARRPLPLPEHGLCTRNAGGNNDLGARSRAPGAGARLLRRLLRRACPRLTGRHSVPGSTG
jgi:hypothetical protein